MKKIIILIVFIVLKSFSFAQFTTITPKLGFTFSNTPGFDNVNYKPGYLFGGSTEYVLTSKFAIKPELLIEQKGCKRDVMFTDLNGWALGTNTLFYTWNYLMLPVQVLYSPFQSNIIYFSAGGYAGYMLWATQRMKGNIDGERINKKSKLDISNYNRWDVGLNIGAGTNIPFGVNDKIEIGFKYEYAFITDRFHLPPATRTFSLSVGYKIRIKE